MVPLFQIEDNIEKHEVLLRNIAGQIWDSPIDIQGTAEGISAAVTNNKVTQGLIKKSIE